MNPELRRNLWLEFSTHRLIAVPAVIVLVLLLIYSAGSKDAAENIAGVAAGGFLALVLLWGTHLAGASVTDEARERTWDAQRMSAIGPWTMTWGKLLGAPAFAWYGGLILLAIFISAGQGVIKVPVLRCALLMICSALLLHAIALNASVLAARKGGGRRGAGVLALIVLLFVIGIPGMRIIDHFQQPLTWWGAQNTHLDFALVSAAVFGAWAVLGAYRSMCNELEIRTKPWALPLFLLFCAVYLAGFPPRATDRGGAGALHAIVAMGVVVSMTAVYLMLFAETRGAAVWQRLHARMRAAQWRRVLEELPLWLVALITGLACALLATLFAQRDVADMPLGEFGLAPLGLMLFAVRDAAIFQFFALARQPKRVETATLFYLALLYWLLPGLLSVAGAGAIADFFLPPLFKQPLISTAIVAVHAAIAIALAWWRWRKIHAPDTA